MTSQEAFEAKSRRISDRLQAASNILAQRRKSSTSTTTTTTEEHDFITDVGPDVAIDDGTDATIDAAIKTAIVEVLICNDASVRDTIPALLASLCGYVAPVLLRLAQHIQSRVQALDPDIDRHAVVTVWSNELARVAKRDPALLTDAEVLKSEWERAVGLKATKEEEDQEDQSFLLPSAGAGKMRIEIEQEEREKEATDKSTLLSFTRTAKDDGDGGQRSEASHSIADLDSDNSRYAFAQLDLIDSRGQKKVSEDMEDVITSVEAAARSLEAGHDL